jgi:hypothetical protein
MQTHRHHAVRTLCLSLGLLTPCLLLGALCLAQESQKTDKPETAGHKFKNIKILKDLPAEKLIPVMRNWNASLGVKCDFCHVINADHSGFEKDDKPTKTMARAMVVMTTDMNKRQKVLAGKATCFMCHQGHQEPQTQPSAGESEEKK